MPVKLIKTSVVSGHVFKKGAIVTATPEVEQKLIDRGFATVDLRTPKPEPEPEPEPEQVDGADVD